MERDPYQVLGVARTATDQEIKSAYRRLTKMYHPDLNPGDKKAEEKMREVNGAYDKIKDAAARSKYNQFGEQPYGGSPYGQNPYSRSPYNQQPYNQSPFGQGGFFYGPFGFGRFTPDDFNQENYEQRRQSTRSSGSGCLGLAIKIFLVVLVFRLLVYFIYGAGGMLMGSNRGASDYQDYQDQTPYTQDYNGDQENVNSQPASPSQAAQEAAEGQGSEAGSQGQEIVQSGGEQ